MFAVHCSAPTPAHVAPRDAASAQHAPNDVAPSAPTGADAAVRTQPIDAAPARRGPSDVALTPDAPAPRGPGDAALATGVDASVRILPVDGAPDRATVLEHALGGMDFVEGPALRATLARFEHSIGRFVELRGAPTAARVLDRVSDHEVRGRDLRTFARRALDAVSAAHGAPRILLAEDELGFPSVHVLWQLPELHKVLVLADANDNDLIYLEAGPGGFNPIWPGLRSLTEVEVRSDLLALAPFFTDTLTIYPHIEAYFLCDPVCDAQ
jgi:hypothetical protein